MILDFTDKQLDLLMRLARFKPKHIRWCKCEYPYLVQMKWHCMYKCTECKGKVSPEKARKEIYQ